MAHAFPAVHFAAEGAASGARERTGKRAGVSSGVSAIERYPGTLVIGGGLAGAAAAIWLARAGRPVRLWERDRQPAHKICGEFLSWEAQHWLAELGLDIDALGAVSISRVKLVTAERVVDAPLGFVAKSLTRHRLDAALLDCAQAAGADIRRGVAARGRGLDGVVAGSHGDIAAASVFLATGKHNLRGVPRDGGGTINHLLGFKAYLRLAPAQRTALSGHIELILFDGGYAGLQMVERDAANLCFLLPPERLQAAGGDFATLLASLGHEVPHLANRLDGAMPLLDKPLAISGVPYGFLYKPGAADPATLWRLGDQAAVIPSFTGDGMSVALHSARLASLAFLMGKPPSAYHRRLARDVGGPLQRATLMQRLADGPGMHRSRVAAMVALFPALLPLAAKFTRLSPGALAKAVG